ncbi:MAG: SLBB domain-containing protein [Rhodothermales bacterium]|nr:SLBB domain-containing protein [Rhodothermales bacterium]
MSAFSRFRRIAFLVTLFAGLASTTSPALGQVASQQGRDTEASTPLDLFRQQIRTAAAGSTVPQEGPVDPDLYVVGPGDLFGISISALQTIAAVLPVSADGSLTLPDAGIVEVAGLTLTEAVDRCLAKLRDRFSNVEVSVSLSAPRQFYVHVVGAVSSPGRFLVMPVSRVSDVLMLAFADTSRAPVGNPDFQPSLRNISLHRRDGSQTSADLLAYFATGDKDHNPYLQDGDVVSVPTFDPARHSVSISGRVAFPGKYDHRDGESVRDLVSVASGIPEGQLRGEVRVSRAVSGKSLDEIVSLEDGGGSDFAIAARDHVFVLPEAADEGFAQIEGKVRYPGTYPIQHGVTTVGDLVRMAGDFQEDALRRGAYLVRRSSSPDARLQPSAGNQVAGLPQTTVASNLFEYPGITSRSLEQDPEALRTMRLSGLDFLNRSYLSQELMLRDRLPVDLEAGSESILLYDGDRVHVPRDNKTVFVFGQVVRPGFLPFAPGATTSDYVRDAGGPGLEAQKIYLVEAGTLRFREGPGLQVRSGDMVFVSRSPDTADSAELQRIALEDRRYQLDDRRLRAETRYRTLSAFLQGVSAVATVAALIITIRKN